MAMAEELPPMASQPPISNSSTLSSYLGISFAVFLGLLPDSYLSHLSSLQSRNRSLSIKLLHADNQLRLMKSRRQEDSKANARVVEIFASHRNAWQLEEKRLLQEIDASAEEVFRLQGRVTELEKSEAELRALVEKLQRDVEEREEVINFMSRRKDMREELGEREEELMEKEVCISQNRGSGFSVSGNVEELGEMYGGGYGCSGFGGIGKIRVSEGLGDPVPDVCFSGRSAEADQMGSFQCYQSALLSRENFSASSGSKIWTERSAGWQDVQYDTSHEPIYQMKHYVPRESPWKVDGESKGISSKLKLMEQELITIEKVGGEEISKVPPILRKQVKRYQTLTSRIDDLCRRMQASDPCEPSLSPEFRTQRQTEFLLETFRLQQRAVETNQKLMALQAETNKSRWEDGLSGLTKVSTRRSLDSIRNSFREVQRNLEVWLARIMGDLEGIHARDGASRISEYYIPKYLSIGKNLY